MNTHVEWKRSERFLVYKLHVNFTSGQFGLSNQMEPSSCNRQSVIYIQGNWVNSMASMSVKVAAFAECLLKYLSAFSSSLYLQMKCNRGQLRLSSIRL